MTTTSRRPNRLELPEGQRQAAQPGTSVGRKGNVVVDWLTTTDHKKIG